MPPSTALPRFRVVTFLIATAMLVGCLAILIWYFPASRLGKGGFAVMVGLLLFVAVASLKREHALRTGVSAGVVSCTLVLAYGALTNDSSLADLATKPAAGPSSTVPSSPSTTPVPSPEPDVSPSASASPSRTEETAVSNLPRAANPLSSDRLIFRRRLDGVWNIVSIRTDGSGPITLTRDGWHSTNPSISTDRRTLFYLKQPDETHKSLHAMTVDGVDDMELFHDRTSACSVLQRPAVSATDIAVACGKPGEIGSLNLLGMDGSLEEKLDSGVIGDPTFVHDGHQIIYWKSYRQNADEGVLMRVNEDGSNATPLISTSDDLDSDPAVSPDGTQLAFCRRVDGQLRLAIVSLTPSSPDVRLVDTGAGDVRDPSWSPNGQDIAFRKGPDATSDLYVISGSGGSPKRVLVNPDRDGGPSWSAR